MRWAVLRRAERGLGSNSVNTASPVTWWVTPDHLNRPVLMTDAAKTQVWQAVWKPFGEAQSITGPAALDTRFPGQWFQIESGLHYNWHRHYDPTTGRYTQPDPLGFVDGPGVYGYGGSATVTKTDRTGLVFGGPGLAQFLKCASLKRRINNLSEAIERQAENLANNPMSLPPMIGPGEDLSSTIRGHQTLLNRYWSHRDKLYDEWRDNKCDDLDKGGGGSCALCGAAAITIGGMCVACALAPELCAPIIIGAGAAAAAQ